MGKEDGRGVCQWGCGEVLKVRLREERSEDGGNEA